MDCTDLYDLYLESDGVVTDSRKDVTNRLFFALKGPKFDGHKYVRDVLQSGATYAVVDDPLMATEQGVICVPDALTALQDLARYHRIKLDIPVLAITGSNGKTTTKELVTSVFAQQYAVHSTKGNFNNLLGLPLTILEADQQHDIMVLEMGSNAFGEITRLCEIALPDFGIITNIGAAHLEAFENLEGVLNEKSSLYHAVASRNGTVFVPGSSEILLQAAQVSQSRFIYRRGEHAAETENDVTVEIKSIVPNIKGDFAQNGSSYAFESTLAGDHNAQNCIAAIAIGIQFNISPESIVQGLKSFVPKNNRSQVIERDNFTILLDAYNANPVSMNKALDVLDNWRSAKKAAVLGDMKELGKYSKQAHEELLTRVKKMDLDHLFLVGEEMQKCNKKAYSNVAELGQDILDHPIDLSGMVILVKGSRSIGLEQFLKYIDLPSQ